jgi:hypothetical protein
MAAVGSVHGRKEKVEVEDDGSKMVVFHWKLAGAPRKVALSAKPLPSLAGPFIS